MKKVKKIFIYALSIVFASLFAILVHSLMPSPGASMNVDDFDSILVKSLGFPIVASSYFIILYLHITVSTNFLAVKSLLIGKKDGLLFGCAFGMIYLFGMQEVVVSSSPFQSYGLDFILYELAMGIGDAVPVILLCLFLCWFNRKLISQQRSKKIDIKEKIITVSSIGILFFIERIVLDKTGVIVSDINKYPLPTLLWTLIFGMVLGCSYLMILSTLKDKDKLSMRLVVSSLIIGVNWIWFNCFIGLIYKNLIGEMLLRGIIDTACIIVGGFISYLLLRKKTSNV